MKRKLTNEIIDGRLLLGKRPLRRVGEVSRSFITTAQENPVALAAQNARSLETYAHEYYSAKVEFDHKWSGHSECRWLFEYELEMLLKYITDNIIPLEEIITDLDPS